MIWETTVELAENTRCQGLLEGWQCSDVRRPVLEEPVDHLAQDELILQDMEDPIVADSRLAKWQKLDVLRENEVAKSERNPSLTSTQS